jgi:hypothetical protein
MKIKTLLIVFILGCCGCGSTIALFDQYAYEKTTSIKVDALNLMEKATENYDQHKTEVDVIDTQISKIIEYESHRPKNQITSKLWTILNDSTAHLYGGFVSRWRSQKKLSAAFIKNQKIIVSKAFDQIAELESGKIKQNTVNP